jgi:hypothetical protein
MSIRLESSPSLTFLDAFSARDRRAAEAAIGRRDEQRRKSFEARDRAGSKLTLDFHGRARTLLGDGKYSSLSHFRWFISSVQVRIAP